MKISEMTHEQLQDYALELEQKDQANQETINTLKGEKEELQGLNKELQKRNNDLFMRVEQQGEGNDPEGKADPEQPPKSCEDTAKDLYRSIIK